MPGRLLNMATNGANNAKPVINGKHSDPGAVQPAVTDNTPSIPGLGKERVNHVVNGDHGIPGLGAYPTPNGVSPSTPLQAHALIPASMSELPEEIQHITENFFPLSKLITRIGEECFNSLADVVDTLADIPVQTQPSLANGATPTGQPPAIGGDNSKENKRKKKIMLDFASDFRTKFVKLLVIANWSGNSKDVSKLIDLLNWGNQQGDHTNAAATGIIDLLYGLRHWKIANPDIDTALAVLSKGDVPWIPHFDLRKTKPLPPEEILETLQRMNTLINLRLVLHEELIPQLRDYRVASGRATFSMKDEFELDVYVASDKYEDPWFFLDVRFLFEPAPQISGDTMRAQIDGALNGLLAEKGLRGACDFVHNFVLTHKLVILGQQAQKLRSGVWADALRVERVHRTVTIQYWTQSPQAKSWIEIGVSSGKDKKRRQKSHDDAITSQIKARWMRNGKEQHDSNVHLDLRELSAERILQEHVARHSSLILETTRDRLESAAEIRSRGEQRNLEMKLTTSEINPSDCSLQVQLGSHPAVDLRIDSITGRLYLSPAGPAAAKAQDALTAMRDPMSEAAAVVRRYLTYEIQLRIERYAETVGWTPVRDLKLGKPSVDEAVKRVTDRSGFFKPRGFKDAKWYIMYTINLSGEYWWIVEVPAGDSLRATQRLKTLDAAGRQMALTLHLLRKIQQLAIRASALYLADKDLTAKGVETAVRQVPIDSSSTPSATDSPRPVQPEMRTKTLPVLVARFSQLMKSKRGHFAQEVLQLRYLGFESAASEVKLLAKGMMKNPKAVQNVLQRANDDNAGFGFDGSFSLMVRTKIGEPCVNKTIAELNKLGTLFDMAKVLKERGIECTDISFTKVSFVFANDLECTLFFKDTPNGQEIKLAVPKDSPHYRIRALLENVVNDRKWGFDRFATALEYFHPVLRVFQRLEKIHQFDLVAAPQVLPRMVDTYRLQYPNPARKDLPWVMFELSFKRNKDDLEWRVAESTPGPIRKERESVFPGINAKILEFMKSVGTGWTGMKTLLVATAVGAEEAILKLDEVVWGAMQQAKDDKEIKKVKEEPGYEVIMID